MQDGKAALSLARVQMTFWFFLVVAAFLYIWTVIGELPKIPASVLALIGIASGTALGSATIDSSKRARAAGELGELKRTQSLSESLKNEIESKTNEAKALEDEIKIINSEPQPNVAMAELKKQNLVRVKELLEKNKQEKISTDARLSSLEEKTKSYEGQQNAVK